MWFPFTEPFQRSCFSRMVRPRRDRFGSLRYPDVPDAHARQASRDRRRTVRRTRARRRSRTARRQRMPAPSRSSAARSRERLKSVLASGRANAERLLLKDRQGRRCAERLCFMQDEIIRVLFEFAAKHLYPSQNPSEAERMASSPPAAMAAACWRPAPTSICLFLLALQADRLGRIGRRGDPLLPVGPRAEGRPCHALDRRMHPPGQGRHDDPHRHPGIALPARRHQAVRRTDGRASTSRSCRAPARNSSPPSSPNAKNVTAAPASHAIWSSPTSRTAKAVCATCTRCSGSPNTSTACATSRN